MKTLFSHQCTIDTLQSVAVRALSGLLLLGSLAACTRDNADPTPSTSGQVATYQAMRTSFNSIEGEWLLTNYQNTPLPASLQNKATLSFTKQSAEVMRMGGRSFVNFYGGSFRLDETKGLIIAKDPINQTLIGASTELLEAESRHLDGLSKATSFELAQNGQLRLYLGDKGNAATEVMIYTRK